MEMNKDKQAEIEADICKCRETYTTLLSELTLMEDELRKREHEVYTSVWAKMDSNDLRKDWCVESRSELTTANNAVNFKLREVFRHLQKLRDAECAYLIALINTLQKKQSDRADNLV